MDFKETYNWRTNFVYNCLELSMLKDSIECFLTAPKNGVNSGHPEVNPG